MAKKVISDERFWKLVDYFEDGNQTKKEACDMIGDEYKRVGSNDLDQAFADVDLLLGGTATKRQYNYLKKNYFSRLQNA